MIKTIFMCCVACFASVAVHGQSSDAIFQWAVAASGYDFHSDLVYKRANGRDLLLDVIAIEPVTEPKPTLLFIHGGGWVNGRKGDTVLAPLPFLARGMNAVNIDYRLADDALAPAAVEDCRCALRWIYRHAKEYGFDTRRIVVAGESAGGHLALLSAMLDESAGFDNECPAQENDAALTLAAVVSYSGPTNLVDLLQTPRQSWFALKWFGGLPNRQEMARRLSPVSYVRPGLPPIILAHSDHDPYVPYEQALQLHTALARAGDRNTLITRPGSTHGWALEKSLSVQEEVFSALQRFGIIKR